MSKLNKSISKSNKPKLTVNSKQNKVHRDANKSTEQRTFFGTIF